jgi:hypothetical protein
VDPAKLLLSSLIYIGDPSKVNAYWRIAPKRRWRQEAAAAATPSRDCCLRSPALSLPLLPPTGWVH